MIRMTGLVDLQSLKEEETPAPEVSDAVESGESLNERSKLAMKLKKLKEMELTPDQEQKVNELMAQMEELTAKQKQLDVDKDGKIEADDLAKLRGDNVDEYNNDYYANQRRAQRKAHWAKKGIDTTKKGPYKPVLMKDTPKVTNPDTGQKINADTAIKAGPNHPAYSAAKAAMAKKNEVVSEGEDHEVGMANNLLDDIIKNATELKGKMGQEEKDIPAWIQDHISQSQNFISQANVNYHEYDKPEDVASPQDMEPMNEAAPEGWEKTIKAMKKHKEIDNPWALANWMKKKGYQPKKES